MNKSKYIYKQKLAFKMAGGEEDWSMVNEIMLQWESKKKWTKQESIKADDSRMRAQAHQGHTHRHI